MAGLFDWLTGAMGGGDMSGGLPPGMSPGGGQMPGMPPVQTLDTAPAPMPPPPMPPGVDPMGGQTGMDMQVGAPPLPPPMSPPDGGFMSPAPPPPALPPPDGGMMPMRNAPIPPPDGGMMSPSGPVPMPAPRPPGLGGGPAAIPPAVAPTGGAGMPPGPPMQLPGPTGAPPPDQGGNALTRALGLDPNRARAAMGGLGAGLKAAGENSHKPGLAAFSGGAGAAIEGGQKTDDKTFEKQDKYLQRAIQAQKEGNTAAYQTNYLKYQIEAAKAKLEVTKATAAAGGKGSVVNSPEQLYLRAVGATNQDASIKISANTVKEAQKQFGADSKEAKAALAAHEKQIETVRNGHFQTLGIDPKSVKGLESKEGFSDKNPVKNFPKDPKAAQAAFDALPDGAYFINPKDGRLLTKKSAGGAAAPNPAQPAGAPMGPPMPPSLNPVPQLEDAE